MLKRKEYINRVEDLIQTWRTQLKHLRQEINQPGSDLGTYKEYLRRMTEHVDQAEQKLGAVKSASDDNWTGPKDKVDAVVINLQQEFQFIQEASKKGQHQNVISWAKGFTDKHELESIGWAQGFAPEDPVHTEGWPEGQATRHTEVESEGWAEGYGKK